MSRTTAAVRNILGMLFQQLVILISGLLIPRLVIQAYGPEVNGFLGSVKALVGYFAIIGYGIDVSAGRQLYGPISRLETNTVQLIINSTAALYRKVSIRFFLLWFVFVCLFVCCNKNVGTHSRLILIGLSVGSVIFIDMLLGGAPRVVLSAHQQVGVESRIHGFTNLAGILLSTCVLTAGGSILAFQSILILVSLFRAIALRRHVLKKFGYNLDPVDFKTDKLNGRWSASVNQITATLIGALPVAILAFIARLEVVNIFCLYNAVFAAMWMLCGMLSHGMAAGFGNLLAQGDKGNLRIAYNDYMVVVLFVGALIYGVGAGAVVDFMTLYTRGLVGSGYQQPCLAFGFLLTGINVILRSVAMTLIDASGKQGEIMRGNLIELTIVIVVSILGAYCWGLKGVLLGVIIVPPIQTYSIYRFISKGIISGYLVSPFRYVVASVSYSMIIYAVVRSLVSTSYFAFFVHSALSLLLFTAVGALGVYLLDRRMCARLIDRCKVMKMKAA